VKWFGSAFEKPKDKDDVLMAQLVCARLCQDLLKPSSGDLPARREKKEQQARGHGVSSDKPANPSATKPKPHACQ
jgi:hypothetical protein